MEPADVGGQCSRPVALLLRLSRARVHLGARGRLTTGRLDLFAPHRHMSSLDFAFGCRRLALKRSAPLGAQAGPERARWPPWKMQRPPLRCLVACRGSESQSKNIATMARMRRRNGQACVWTAEARRNVEVGSWTVEARRPSKRRGDRLQLRLSHLTSTLI